MTTSTDTSTAGQLQVADLVKVYPTRAEPLRVLDGVSFELNVGEALVVMGPSGSGKSTLLSILGALEPPSEGRVTLDGIDPFSQGERDLARFRNRTIGFVFQEHHLLPQCSALENVLLPTLAGGATTEDVEARARGLLDRVGLSDRLDHRPAELSGGERQRTALARALINAPRLLLCDEPTGNLDRTTATEIGDLLAELHAEQGVMMVIVTHSPELGRRFGRRVELDRGRFRECGEP